MTDLTNINPLVLERMLVHLREGSKIRAIKAYVEMTGGSLQDGKEVAEALLEGLESEDQTSSGRGVNFEWEGLDEQEKRAVLQQVGFGNKILAIKILREMTGMGLKQAKDWVDQLGDPGGPPPLPPARTPDNDEWVEEVMDLLRHDKKIEAIKRFREHTGLGLKEAKDKVDKLEKALRYIPEGQRVKVQMELSASVDPPPVVQTQPPPMPEDYGLGIEAPSITTPTPKIEVSTEKLEITDQPRRRKTPPRTPPPPQRDARADALDTLHSEITFLMRTGQKKKAIQRYAETMKVSEGAAKQEIKRIVSASPFGKNKKEGCFIVTACCGEDSPEVARLRRFRDERLLPRRAGRLFVSIYYLVSPPLARKLESRPLGKSLVRRFFIRPIVDGLSGDD